MGVRGELFSTRVILPNRTYFFNVKENRLGDLYLNIVESKNQETGGFERQSVIVFSEDLSAFLGEFDKALKVLEKSVREQKDGGGKRRDTHRDGEYRREDDRDSHEPSGRGKTDFRKKDGFSAPRRGGGESSFRKDRDSPEYSGNRGKAAGRRNSAEGSRSGYSGGKARAGETSFRKERDSAGYSGSRGKSARGTSAEGSPHDKGRGGKRVVVKKTRRD